MNDSSRAQNAGCRQSSRPGIAHHIEKTATAYDGPRLGRPLCLFRLPPPVRRRIYELVLQQYSEIRPYAAVGTTPLHRCPLFECPVLVRNDQKNLFSAIRLPFRQSRKWRSRHVEGIVSPPIYAFLRQPLLRCPPAEFPRIDYQGLDNSMKVLIDADLREAQPPCVTITPYQLPQEDMPFFIEVRRQLQSAGWYAYFDDAMERLSGLISKAIERRGGYGITTDELQLIVDFGKDLAHVMVSFLALGERLTNQAARRRGRSTATQQGQRFATETATKTPEATTNIPCKQQTISFFDLPPEIRARVYAHLLIKQSLTEPQHDRYMLTSLHKFHPQPLLRLPEILRIEGSHTFDHLRMCIYLFSIDDRRKQSWNGQTFPSWSLEELLSKKTAAWLRDSGPGRTIEFNHLRVCGPEKVRYDIDVIDNGRDVRIRDRRSITDRLADIDGGVRRCQERLGQERTKLELLAERLERSIRDRQGAGISAVEIGLLIDGMLEVMLARRYIGRGDEDEMMV